MQFFLSVISTKTCFMEAVKAQANLKARLKVCCSLWMEALKFKCSSRRYTTALLSRCPKNQFRREKSETQHRTTQTSSEQTWWSRTKETRTRAKESVECVDEVFMREPLSVDLSSLSNPHMTGLSRRCTVIFSWSETFPLFYLCTCHLEWFEKNDLKYFSFS